MKIAFCGKTYRNKEWLLDKYWGELLSTTETAKLAGCSHYAIEQWLEKHNIPKRTNSQSVHIKNRNYSNIPKEGLEFIYGDMLGDGCIVKKSPYSAYIAYGCKHKKYIEWMSKKLKKFSIEQAGKIIKRKSNNSVVYHYQSKSYPELLKLYNKWYIKYQGSNPKRKTFKIIPEDVELTPLVCRQWYIGDGSLPKVKNRSQYIILATNAFRKKDLKLLRDKLKEININTYLHKDNRIGITTESTPIFLNYIESPPKEIEKYFGYKWEYVTYKKEKKL